MTLVANVVLPVSGSELLDLAEHADPRRIDDGVDTTQSSGCFLHCLATRRLVGDIAPDGQGSRAGLLGCIGQEVLPPSQQCHIGTTLREADANAPPQPSRRPHNDGSHVRPPFSR